MRHELKTVITKGDYYELNSRLGPLFSTDSHADAHGEYRVRSLYFDSPFDSALQDKKNGVPRREKFRIRLYNNDCSFIRLEKKIKINNLYKKVSVPVSQEQVALLLCGEKKWMLESENSLIQELYAKMTTKLLRPQVVVEYLRRAYVFSPGNVRLTLDRSIQSCSEKNSFLDGRLPLAHAGEEYAVLEVKYDSFLPDIVRSAVSLPGRYTSAFSKYAFSRRFG